MKKILFAGLSVTCCNFTFTADAETAISENIERINVIGSQQATVAQLSLDDMVSSEVDFRDAMKKLPGVHTNNNGPVTAVTQYRGLFGDRVPLLFAGSPLAGAGPNAMDSPLSHVFAMPGTSISLHRGIAPVSHGAETLTSNIRVNVFDDAAFTSESEWFSKLSAGFGEQGNARNTSLMGGYANADTYLHGFIADQQQDDVEDGENGRIPNSFFDRQAFGLNTGWRTNKHQFNGHYQVVDTGESGTAALAMDIIYIDSRSYRLQYQYEPSLHSQLTLSASGNSNQHGMNNFSFRSRMDPMARLNTVDSLSRGYNAQWLQHLDGSVLTAGANWHSQSHNSVITNPKLNNLTINNFNNIERTLASGYLQWDTNVSDITYSGGMRYTRVEMSAGNVSNSMAMMNPMVATLVNRFNDADRNKDFDFVDLTLHATSPLSDNWSWQIGMAQKNRAPSYTEMFVWLPLGISAGRADGRNYLGNLDLQHETASQIDLSVTYANDKLTIAPRLFYQQVADFIVGDPSTDMPANRISNMMTGNIPLQWQNVDATLYGADLEALASINKHWSVQMIASYVKAERDDSNTPLYRIAPATLITTLQWETGQWQLALESELAARQSSVSEQQNEQRSAGYGVFNAHFTYNINKNLAIKGIVSNLFDKQYQPHLGGINRVAGEALPVGEKLFAQGRDINLTIALQF
ncbi:TonB-dependent receptor [Alteromonas sediminis]|uniref:TonB-dependent receptor n=1 Tax=Alteromonas sediminis TaxID=2259342 RepID=A0A3N5ZDD2_9ALTE|nr:TonB-dependent receptor [Alteromonas sediminis]RPJ68038.1 TonB-dependent receptor [Alteromonas sediminis]